MKVVRYLKQHPFVFILAAIIAWRLFLTIGWLLGNWLIPVFDPSFPYFHDALEYNPSWIWPWGNFDGVHYLLIAERGYIYEYYQVFFPLYPLAIRGLTSLVQNYLASGLIISHLALLAASYFLIKIGHQVKLSLPLLLVTYLIFPTSFYLGSVYTESLFLMLSLATFYFAFQNRWWLSGLSGGLATLTRVSGIFLFPSLLIIWWQQRKLSSHSEPKQLKDQLSFFWLLLIPAGLLIYMLYLNYQVHDPLYFIHAQPYFSSYRQVNTFTLWPQVVWRYIKMLVTVNPLTPTYFTTCIEMLIGLGFAWLSILSWKRLGPALGIYTLSNYLLPTFTGSFSSVPRYVLILFPAFIVLSQEIRAHRWFRLVYFSLSPVLLLSCVIYFTRGWWVG